MLLSLLAACRDAAGPAPRIDAVTPGLVADDGAAVPITISGEGFTPIPHAVLTDPAVGWPRLSLIRTGDITGRDDAQPTRIDLTVAGALRWIDGGTLTFDASPAIGLFPGDWTVRVEDADGQVAELPDALIVAAPPKIEAVDPADVCIEDDSADVTLTGTDLLVIDGVSPTVAVGPSGPLATTASDCTPLAGGRADTTCTTLTTTVTPSSLPLGAIAVTATDPSPLTATSDPETLTVNLPPTITAVAPQATCSGGAVLTITGERFPADPVVTVGGVEVASVTRVDPQTLEVVLADGTPTGRLDVTVSEGGTCAATLEAAIEVVGDPDVYYVDPPALVQGLSVAATAYIADLTADVEGAWVRDERGAVIDLDFAWDPDEPGRLVATLPGDLDPGAYTFGITEADGCAAELPDAVNIAATATVAITGVDPGFAWEWNDTPIDVVGDDPVPDGMEPFGDTPRVYLTPTGDGTTASAVRSVVWRDDALLTGAVPAELAPGLYDVLVVNPDGAVGYLEAGVEVTDEPAPDIDSVSPASLSNNRSETITVHGRYFRDPAVSLDCREAGVETTVAATVTASTYTEITATVPATSFSQAVCVVVATNSDGTTGRWAAVSIRNPSANLFGWAAGTDMVEARRGLAAVAGRTSSVSRWVYAIGGDAGDVATAKVTVERAPVGVYGDLGDWELLPTELPAPTTLAGAAIVGRFAYLVGGDTGSGAVASVWRAEILDPFEIPHLDHLSIDDGGTLGAGDWTWRVAALYDATNTANPGGESLPSDPILVTLPDRGDLSVTLTWTAVHGAVGYRIYRSPAADTDGGEEWVGDTTDTTWTDTGVATDGSHVPLPEGSLGTWAEMPAMLTARSSPCVAIAPDPTPDPEITWLYVAGGQDASGGALASIEALPITVVDPHTQTVGSWIDAGVTLSEARWACGAWTVDDALHTVVGPGETWVYFGGGETGRRTSGTVDAARVASGGTLTDWQTVDEMSPTRSGFATASASDYLYAFGGQHGGASTGGVSTELTAGTMPAVGNWNSLGTSLTTARHLAGSAQESSVIFVLGGESDADAATRSTDVTNY